MSNAANPRGRSPYVRYQKRPHVYSAAFHAWRDAARRGDASAMEAADQAWRRQIPALHAKLEAASRLEALGAAA